MPHLSQLPVKVFFEVAGASQLGHHACVEHPGSFMLSLSGVVDDVADGLAQPGRETIQNGPTTCMSLSPFNTMDVKQPNQEKFGAFQAHKL
eukprot:1149413-Pelagomonas_calceolata.AAC.20